MNMNLLYIEDFVKYKVEILLQGFRRLNSKVNHFGDSKLPEFMAPIFPDYWQVTLNSRSSGVRNSPEVERSVSPMPGGGWAP